MSTKIFNRNNRYLLLAVIFILMGLTLVFLPEKDNTKKLQPEQLLINLNDNSRFLSTDQVANRLINQDPSMLLIDVRSSEEYDKGSLPGAINIPVDQILKEESVNLLGRKAYDKILFSNSDVLADQAWVILSGKLLERLYIMDGGVNKWVETIVNPVKPDERAPIEAFEMYDFRVGASRYFTGLSTPFEYIDFDKKPNSTQKSKKSAKVTAPPVLPPPPVEEEAEDEGC